MFRNQYDTDVVTWSPQGRIHQIEYAMEAVKQGSASVGLRSKTHVVLGTLKRAPSELSAYQRKVFKVDDHMGTAVSGLISDGRSICRYMRNECLNHRYVYESPMPTSRLVRQIADRAQVNTQRSWKRPYGVGLLTAGVDKTGPKLYYNCPSGNYYEYLAMAIGARSQAAKTYLERSFESFEGCSVDELVRHALRALSASVTDGELSAANCTVALVGPDMPFTILEDEDLEPHVAAFKDQDDGADAGGAGDMAVEDEPDVEAAEGGEGDDAAPMDT